MISSTSFDNFEPLIPFSVLADPSGRKAPPAQATLRRPVTQPPSAPAAVQGSVAYASFKQRAAAVVIDRLVVPIACLAFMIVLGGGDELIRAVQGQPMQGGILFFLLMLATLLLWAALSLAYAALTMARTGKRNGQTLGKQLLGIRTVRADGKPYTAGSAFYREVIVKQLGYLILGILPFGGLAAAGSHLWMLRDGERCTGHDLICASRVVRA